MLSVSRSGDRSELLKVSRGYAGYMLQKLACTMLPVAMHSES